jgi:hypothetical protein
MFEPLAPLSSDNAHTKTSSDVYDTVVKAQIYATDGTRLLLRDILFVAANVVLGSERLT